MCMIDASLILLWSVVGRITLNLLYFLSRENSDDSVWWTVFTILIVATVAVRFYNLDKPAQVW